MKTLKRLLCFGALAVASLAAQTQTVTLTVTMSTPVLMDIHQYWLDHTTAVMGNVAGAVDATTTSVTVSVSQSQLSAQVPLFAVGQAALLGAEPMTVTAISGSAPQSVTLQRNQYILSPMVVHAAGSAISLLKYPTPWVMLDTEALWSWAQQVIQSLGARSVTLGSTVTGIIQ